MDSRKALFAIFGSVALTTVIGILLSLYKDTFRRNKITEEVRDKDTAGEPIKDPVANAKNQLKEMDEDADRMVNEGGKWYDS